MKKNILFISKTIITLFLCFSFLLGTTARGNEKSSETPKPAPQNQPDTNDKKIEPNKSGGFLKDIPSELASPWTTDARPWLLAGAGATALLFALRKEIGDPMQKSWDQNRPLGGWAKAGDYGGKTIQNSLYGIGMLTHYWITKDDVSLDRFIVMLKASLYASGVSTILKVSVREARPNNPTDTASFPSGHAMIAFAFSSVIIAEHGFFPYGLPALAYATLTGLSRINDNKHRLHDVVAGATVGTAYGLGVSYFHQARRNSPENAGIQSSNFDIAPIFSDEEKGLNITYHF